MESCYSLQAWEVAENEKSVIENKKGKIIKQWISEELGSYQIFSEGLNTYLFDRP